MFHNRDKRLQDLNDELLAEEEEWLEEEEAEYEEDFDEDLLTEEYDYEEDEAVDFCEEDEQEEPAVYRNHLNRYGRGSPKVFDFDEYEEEDNFEIRVKTFPFKPMTPEEAILQMNLIGHAFYAFTDSESGETCVVYKRKAGSYGLIVPER